MVYRVPVEGVEEFICLGSKQSYNGYSRPDVLRRIGLVCSMMNSLQRVWKCSSLNINTKVHLYQALVMSVLLYGAATWTLLAADMKTLEAFHMRCQRQILDIRWWAHVSMQRCFSNLVCQPLVTSCDIDAYLCLAMFHAWILECQHMMLCI